MNLLFLCVENSARSQIAEGLAKQIFDASVTVASAGSNPSGAVNPFAIEVLREKGIDISHHKSKSVNQLPNEFLDNLDFIIFLCSDEICPIITSRAKQIRWPLHDPASTPPGTELAAFRRTRDEISELLEAWKQALQK